ncbi:MAG TPA: TonB family protein [Pyrinomonadaceae bacterium]|jgi:TonB family protein
MQHLILRLLVAVLTFGLGVASSMVLNLFRPAQTEVETSLRAERMLVMTSDHTYERPSVSDPVLPTERKSYLRQVLQGGILNGKAISKPQPAYPSTARAARASGTVVVEIVVDEEGNVVSARAASGHPLLQQAAVAAAREARFAPTRLSGQPVKVSGVITYNFVLE